MNTQIVLTTILAGVQLVSFGSWVMNLAELKDKLWIEPLVIIVSCALFIYLIWK